MPISVVVKDEHGRRLARLDDVHTSLPVQSVAIAADLLPLGRHETYPMLGYIDPYGDTCFNSAQARAVLIEFRSWDQEVQSESSRALLAGVTVLVAAHMSRPHRYLWFIGD